ncbi:hypothetical protein H4684_004014 [Desulfomicrobium macestii]|uniref:HNH endonuclease 5 domain-containing protein n=1 Tax=Desulfomicrobium macestii TaxID=90731 RepID=A0ABR9HA21_9BACT|nr:HNH endonuclease [Desulfomicrobium macestii]MBE1427322.1 hypothetical protein [Desulfomicrobium macestii]
MDSCYLCGKAFNGVDVIKHDEHIIQQAIGGSLTGNDILCASCGGKLGNDIDVPFTQMFSGIATRLNIKKDRNSNKYKSVKGILLSKVDQYNIKMNQIDVLCKEFEVTPLKPFHKYTDDKRKVIIYGNKKVTNQYRKKVEVEISEKFSSHELPEIIICNDIEGLVSYPLSLDNKVLKQGLAKIAVGFASKYGIPRTEFPLALDISKEEPIFLDKPLVVPFYPLGIIDRHIEAERNKLCHYPTHTAIIFTTITNPKCLACYIDLFSTFQFYVVLNNNYTGEDIYKYFTQRILRKDDYKFELNRKYYKERNIHLDSLGITEHRIDGLFENQTNTPENNKSREEIECEIIQEEYIKQKYRIDLEDDVSGYVSYVMRDKMLSDNIEKLDMESVMNFKRNFDLFYSVQGDDEIFDISSYRRYFSYNNVLIDFLYSSMQSSKELYRSGELRNYCHLKVKMLEDFIQREGIKIKFNL